MRLVSPLYAGGMYFFRILSIFWLYNIFLDSGKDNKFIIAMTQTFLQETLFSFRTKFINWKLTPCFTKSLSKIWEFRAKFPKAAAAFDLVFYSESFIKLIKIGIVGLKAS